MNRNLEIFQETLAIEERKRTPRTVVAHALADAEAIACPDAMKTLIEKHPKFETDERYSAMLRETRKFGIRTLYYSNLLYEDVVQLTPDEITKLAQCRLNALDPLRLMQFIGRFNGGEEIKKPPIGVFIRSKVYAASGNHRIHGKVASDNPSGPMLVLIDEDQKFSEAELIMILQALANISNSATEDDVETDSADDIIYQFQQIFKTLNAFDLGSYNPAFEEYAVYVRLINDAKVDKKKNAVEKAQKDIIKTHLNITKPFYLKGLKPKHAAKEVTKIWNRVFNDEEFLQKLTYPANDSKRQNVEQELFQSLSGEAFSKEEKTDTHSFASTASFSQLFSSHLNHLHRIFMKGELENFPEKMKIIIRADEKTDRLSTREKAVDGVKAWIEAYNKGQSELNLGRVVSTSDTGQVEEWLPNPKVEIVMFPAFFNDTQDSNRIFVETSGGFREIKSR